MAPAPSDTLSGSLNVKSAGWTTVGRRTPWTGGVAQKRTAGSRLYLPRRVGRLPGSGIPGSMQTRSPIASEVTAEPTSTTSPDALVAEDHGLVHDEGADPPVDVVVDVAPADADPLEGDSHVARPERLLDLDGTQGQLVLAFQNQCLHFIPPPVVRWLNSVGVA